MASHDGTDGRAAASVFTVNRLAIIEIRPRRDGDVRGRDFRVICGRMFGSAQSNAVRRPLGKP